MSKATQLKINLVNRILEGPGVASRVDRSRAFTNVGLAGSLGSLVDGVAKGGSGLSDQDFHAAESAGFNEEEIFEIVVCAAVGQASRQYESAVAVLEASYGGMSSCD